MPLTAGPNVIHNWSHRPLPRDRWGSCCLKPRRPAPSPPVEEPWWGRSPEGSDPSWLSSGRPCPCKNLLQTSPQSFFNKTLWLALSQCTDQALP